MSWETWIWIGVMGVGFLGSAAFSGIETGCYAVNRVKLHLLASQGTRSAVRLESWLQRPRSLLSTLLIGNNLCNYLGTFGLAVLLQRAGFSDSQQAVLNILIVTPLLLVFGETLPKDLFSGYTEKLLYPLVPVVAVVKGGLTLCGLVPLVAAFGDLVVRMLGGGNSAALAHPRRRVQALLREGLGHGVITHQQSDLLERVFLAERRTVADEMVPWAGVRTVAADTPPDALFDLAETTSRSRLPVVRDGQVVGVLDVFELLMHTRGDCPPLDTLTRPAAFVLPRLGLRSGWRAFQTHGWGLAVVGTAERPLGVVTMKDLVEPIVGELVRW